jgi:hypothetical protein
MTRSTSPSNRSWDELRAAGGELSAYGGDIATIVSRVQRYFEVPHTPEEEAIGVFLIGLTDALDSAAPLDDDPPEAAP